MDAGWFCAHDPPDFISDRGMRMAKILGVGGLFFKSADPAAMKTWYADVLGIPADEWGAFFTPDAAAAHPGAGTAFSPFAADTDYFAPSDKEFMFNLLVDDLNGMLARCADHGVLPVKLMPDEGMGPFAHIMDPEGRKIELWQPKPMG
jgi:predicted enzyme related to lactoylglutathione lyase